MSQQLTTTVSARLPMPLDAPVKPQQWRVLTDAIFPNAKTSESVLMALEYCRVRNLDPFKRPVHIVPMYSTAAKRMIETVWPGINELQVTAARSGAWAGMDEPAWGPEKEYTFAGGGGEDENGERLPARNVTVRVPESCTVTVYRIVGDRREAFAEPVYWMEAYAHAGRSEMPNAMWLKRPRGQLHKCAKAASLRAAFPEDLGSVYAAEEMEDKETDARGPVIEVRAETHRQIVHQEEESEFVIRADAALMEAAAKSASAWLKAFIAIMGDCPTLADHAAICGWPSVQEAQAKAPTIIRSQLTDAIKAAETRLTSVSEAAETKPEPKSDAAPDAVEATTTDDTDALHAAELIKAIDRWQLDADVVRFNIDKEIKKQLDDWKVRRPDLHKLVDDARVAKRKALNDPDKLV